MDINFMSYVSLMMLFMKQNEIKKAGQHRFQLVNVSSIAGHMTSSRNSDYSASKFALDGFGKALQAEVAQFNINVLQIYPGYVKTNISKNALTGNGNL